MHNSKNIIQIRILGCGPSGGIPYVGCDCKTCLPSTWANKRSRTSIILTSFSTSKNWEEDEREASVLIDVTPDLNSQIFYNFGSNPPDIEAIILTHAHYDHVGGIPDIYNIHKITNKVFPIISYEDAILEVKDKFNYMFGVLPNGNGKKILKSNTIEINSHFAISHINCRTFEQQHGNSKSMGIIFDQEVVYSTDVSSISDENLEVLANTKPTLWILGCIGMSDRKSHIGLETAIKWSKIVKPKEMILTHMSHELEYNETCRMLFRRGLHNIRPAHCGMSILVQGDKCYIS